MKEIWKDIPGLEGYYQASNIGLVRSVTRIVPGRNYGKSAVKGRILSLWFSAIRDGYDLFR